VSRDLGPWRTLPRSGGLTPARIASQGSHPSVKTGVHATLRCERIPSGGRTVIVILPAAARPPAGVPTAVKYPDDDEMPLT
jgi:hypothetical protein